jgi:putative endonuclease
MMECRDKSLYTGITNDLERRLAAHNSKKGGRYTRAHAPVKMVYSEVCKNRSQALKREYKIKSLERTEKLALIPS